MPDFPAAMGLTTRTGLTASAGLGLKGLMTLTLCLCPQMVTRTKKIFVGGLSAPSTLEDVKNYFEQFGRVSR